MNIIAQAVIFADTPCCPKCGSNSNVGYGGRGGGSGRSTDTWTCSRDRYTWTTPAS